MNRKKPVYNDIEDDNIIQPEFEVFENPEEIPNDLDTDLQEWIDSVNVTEDDSYTTTLYKYDNPRHGQRKEFCSQWTDEAPSLHDIGALFGGGRYNMIVSFPKNASGERLIRSYKFRIHDSYDRLSGGPVQPAQQQNNSLRENVQLMKELFSMIAPLIQPQREEKKESALQSVSMVNDVLKESAKNQLSLYKEFMGQMKELDISTAEIEEEEEESTGSALLKMIEPLLQQYLPLLIGSGPKSKVAIETVKALPQFKQTVKNKKELMQLIDYIYKNEGKEKTVQLLKNLKISLASLPVKYKNLLK